MRRELEMGREMRALALEVRERESARVRFDAVQAPVRSDLSFCVKKTFNAGAEAQMIAK